MLTTLCYELEEAFADRAMADLFDFAHEDEVKSYGDAAIAQAFEREFPDSCLEEAGHMEYLGYSTLKQACSGYGRKNLFNNICKRAMDWAVADLEQEQEEAE